MQQLYGLEDRDPSQKCKTIPIKDIQLLYKFAENNLLEYLLYIKNDRDNPDKKIWFFEHNSYIQDIYNQFYMPSDIKNNKKRRNLK